MREHIGPVRGVWEYLMFIYFLDPVTSEGKSSYLAAPTTLEDFEIFKTLSTSLLSRNFIYLEENSQFSE